MSTNVYANDNEICSKASSGKSGPAAPDVCMSPPGPSAGPIPIPYANIGKASDLKAGSSTVFIKKKEVALKNVSFFLPVVVMKVQHALLKKVFLPV